MNHPFHKVHFFSYLTAEPPAYFCNIRVPECIRTVTEYLICLGQTCNMSIFKIQQITCLEMYELYSKKWCLKNPIKVNTQMQIHTGMLHKKTMHGKRTGFTHRHYVIKKLYLHRTIIAQLWQNNSDYVLESWEYWQTSKGPACFRHSADKNILLEIIKSTIQEHFTRR